MRLSLALVLVSVSLLGQDAALEHARQVNLERAANMPNFVADEIAQRYTRHSDYSKWRLGDTIETEKDALIRLNYTCFHSNLRLGVASQVLRSV